jgi:AIG2 family protein
MDSGSIRAMPYFFAYGARMSADHMQGDTPDATLVGPAKLEGYRLAFNVPSRSWGGGAANAVPAIGGHLWGVLWEIGEGATEAFDSFRGDESMQHVLDVQVQGPDGPVTATTFAVDSPEQFVAPTDRYLAMIRTIAEQQGLPDEAIQDIDAAAKGGSRGPTPSI